MRSSMQILLTLTLVTASIITFAANKKIGSPASPESANVYSHQNVELHPGTHSQQLDDTINMQGLIASQSATKKGGDIILSS
jgi:hypothetical protein